MPLYTYQCEECGVRFDVKQKFTDEPITVCPECQGATHRVITPVGVVFKGSGFYVNDSRSNHSTLTGSSKKENKDGGESTASKPEKTETNKPAAKPSGGE